MAFVYEEVGKENEALWNEIGWRDWGGNPKTFRAKAHWCADKEHGIYMLPIGSYRHETPDYFDLAYKKIVVRTEITRYQGASIDRICIPVSVWKYRDDICKCIKDALVAYGKMYDQNLEIDVKFNCNPECVEVDYNGR